MSFYAALFDGSVEVAVKWGESPMKTDVPHGYEGKLMHSSVRFGDQQLMGSDGLPGRYVPGSTITVSIAVTEVDEGQRIFDALAEGGTVQMPFQKMFWTEGFDRFGVPWMVNCEVKRS